MQGYKSIKETISYVVMNLGLGDKQIPWLDFIEWGMYVLQQIRAYSQFLEVQDYVIELENGRGKLPTDFYRSNENPGLIYKIVGDTIIVDSKEESVKFNYLAFMTDDEGFLMIPDIVSYDEAIMWHVASRLAIRDELPNKQLTHQYCNQMYHMYVKQARSRANELSEDQKAMFAKGHLTFNTDIHMYLNKFKGLENGRY
jgi:hypothetical protein